MSFCSSEPPYEDEHGNKGYRLDLSDNDLKALIDEVVHHGPDMQPEALTLKAKAASDPETSSTAKAYSPLRQGGSGGLEKFEGACESLEHIIIRGCSEDTPPGWRPFQYLHCGFAKISATEKIHSMKLSGIDFRQPARSYKEISPSSYPALKYLVSDGCVYDELPRREPSVEDQASLPVTARSDPLHRAPRTAANLEYLKVVHEAPWRWEGDSRSRDLPLVPGKKVTLRHLKTAIILPPICKMLDIEAPNLTARSYEAHHEYRTTGQPMISTVEESLVKFVTLPKLEYVGFECSRDYSLSRLEEWLPHLRSVTKITVRGGKQSFGKNFVPPQDDQRVQMRFMEALATHLDWLPRLNHLQLVNCYVPEIVLRDYLKQRRASKTCSSVTNLDLDSCSDVQTRIRRQIEKDTKCNWFSWRGIDYQAKDVEEAYTW